jgi:hypothetical protein
MANKQTTSNLIATISNLVEGATIENGRYIQLDLSQIKKDLIKIGYDEEQAVSIVNNAKSKLGFGSDATYGRFFNINTRHSPSNPPLTIENVVSSFTDCLVSEIKKIERESYIKELVTKNTIRVSPTKFGEVTARIELEPIKNGLKKMGYSNSEVNTVIRNYTTLLKQKPREISTGIKESREIINTRIENTGEYLYIILENDFRNRGNPTLESEFTSIVSKLPEYLERIVKNLSEAQDKEKSTNPLGQLTGAVVKAFTAFVSGRGQDGNKRQ